MKAIRRSEHLQVRANSGRSVLGDLFFFYEKSTGVAHFQLEAGPNGRFPVDQSAGLSAMYCMVRGQSTSDYIVMVQAEDDILEGLKEKADKLLEAGKSVEMVEHRNLRPSRCHLLNTLNYNKFPADRQNIRFGSLLAMFDPDEDCPSR